MEHGIGGCWDCTHSDFGDSNRDRPAPPAKNGECVISKIGKYRKELGRMALIKSNVKIGVNSHSACGVFSKTDGEYHASFDARPVIKTDQDVSPSTNACFTNFDAETAKAMLELGLIDAGHQVFTNHRHQEKVHIHKKEIVEKLRTKAIYSNLYKK